MYKDNYEGLNRIIQHTAIQTNTEIHLEPFIESYGKHISDTTLNVSIQTSLKMLNISWSCIF